MLISAHVSLADWTSLGGLAFAALAAFFAGRAVHYAHQTVKDGEIAREAAATRHAEQIAEIMSLLTATHDAHEEEASDRRRLYDHDLIIRRVAQMQRISEVLADLIDAARSEWTNPTPRHDLGSGRMLAATPIMALQERLRLEVQVLESLGGPKIADWVPPLTRDDDAPGLQRLWTSEGLTALARIKGMVQSYEALQPDGIFDRDHESTRPDEAQRRTREVLRMTRRRKTSPPDRSPRTAIILASPSGRVLHGLADRESTRAAVV